MNSDTDSRMVVIRGEGAWGEDEEGKGVQIYGDGHSLLFIENCMVIPHLLFTLQMMDN